MTDVNSGKKVTEARYKGSVILLFFGYTFCPDVCPTTLATLSQVMERMNGVNKRISILFVTVDPDRDTAENLRTYLDYFPVNVHGLLGTPNELADFARRYRVAYTVNLGSDPDFYTMNHTATLFLFNQDGELTSLAPYGTSAEDIEHDLRLLVEKTEP